MKTTIQINGLAVEFSDVLPTKQGVYWWMQQDLAHPWFNVIEKRDDGELIVWGYATPRPLAGFYKGSLWSAPLVPEDGKLAEYKAALNLCKMALMAITFEDYNAFSDDALAAIAKLKEETK